MTVEISSAILDRLMGETIMYDRRETCGILRGWGGRILRADRAINVSPTPFTAFEIDPETLIAACRQARRPSSYDIVGYYHSHPTGDVMPSKRDAELAEPDGKLWLIFSRTRAQIWRATNAGQIFGRFDHVKFDLRVGKHVRQGIDEVRHRDLGRMFDVRFEQGTKL
jgi:desampylase